MPEAKPVAPKGSEDGTKFARALRDEQPKERAQSTAATPAKTTPRDQNKENKLETPTRPLRDDKPVVSSGGKKSLSAGDSSPELPKVLEDALKKSASEASPETLSLIANLLMQGGPIKDNVPVLAVLTGDFSRLAAQDVPGVVLNSPFVAKALASDGVNDFLNTKTTIGDLLGSLNIEPSVLAGLEQRGINLEESVTPRKLLNAVGVDTQIIQAELQNLKGNLQLEGLRSYVERATRIRPETVAPAMPRAPQIGVEIPVEIMAEGNAHVSEAPFELAAPVMDPTATVNENVAPSQDATFATQDPTPRARLVESSPFEALGEKMAGLATAPASAESSLAATKTLDQPAPADDAVPLSSDESSLLTFMSPAAPEAERPAAPAPNSIAALEKLFGMKMGEDSATVATPLTTTPTEGEQEPALVQEAPNTPMRAMTMDELIARLQKPERASSPETATLTAAGDTTAFAPVEEAAADLGSSDEQSSGDLAQQGESGLIQRNDSAGLDHIQKANFAAEIMEVAQAVAAPETHEAVRQSVFENATMMLQEGGGSIRIDLGGKDMGVLDLAVNVRDDQLDLRIIASSENVREILTQDIPRLKDSLSQQNLQLRNIEIAVSQSGAWAGQSNNGGFRDSHQQFNAPRGEKGGEVARPAAFASRVRSYVPGARTGNMAQAGRIQVLV